MKALSIFTLSLSCFLFNLAMDSSSILSKLAEGILSQETKKVTSHIEYGGFLDLCKEVESHREERLITWKTFQAYAKDPNTIILDTRSREKFNLRHIEGAVNLPFSEFTATALNKATGYNTENRILIYCNNNFMGDQVSMRAKGMPVIPTKKISLKKDKNSTKSKKRKTQKNLLDRYEQSVGKGPSLALNLPTYMTLYGYGYHNVYELADLLDINDDSVRDHWKTNGSGALYIDGVKVN